MLGQQHKIKERQVQEICIGTDGESAFVRAWKTEEKNDDRKENQGNKRGFKNNKLSKNEKKQSKKEWRT